MEIILDHLGRSDEVTRVFKSRDFLAKVSLRGRCGYRSVREV